MMEQPPGHREPETDDLNLEVVMTRHQTALWRYTLRVLNNRNAAQAVVQETFIQLHAHWDAVNGQGTDLKAWLFRTAHKITFATIRKASRCRLLNPRQAMETDWAVSAHELRQVHDARHIAMLQHLTSLKPAEREVLVLRSQERMSCQEIALVIHRPEAYVRSLVHTATDRLIQRLRQEGVLS